MNKKPKSSGQWEFISPEQAEKNLANQAKNRKVNESLVKKYVGLMNNGDWDERNPQPIIFNDDGKMCNGQHRMKAVIKSGKGFWFYIMRGVENEVALVIDDASSRSDADAMEIAMCLGDADDEKKFNPFIKVWKFMKFSAPINKAMYSRHELKRDLENQSVMEAIVFAKKDMPSEFHQSALLGGIAAAHFADEDTLRLEAFKDVFISGGDVCEDTSLACAYALKKHIETGKISTAKSKGLHTANNGNTYFQRAVWLYLGRFLRNESPPKQLRDELVNGTISPWNWGKIVEVAAS